MADDGDRGSSGSTADGADKGSSAFADALSEGDLAWIVKGFEEGDCILMLGSEVDVVTPSGERRVRREWSPGALRANVAASSALIFGGGFSLRRRPQPIASSGKSPANHQQALRNGSQTG